MPDLVVQPGDSSPVVHLVVGQRLDVRLAVRFANGFRWTVAAIDGEAVTFERTTGLYGKDVEGQVPAGYDVQSLTFLARKTGSATIKLHFKRPWATDARPRETRTVSVVVN